MTKLVICFAGTDDPGDQYATRTDQQCYFSDEVLRIYLRGCQHKDTGNGYLFPDLDKVANKIRSAFTAKQFNLASLKNELKDGICSIQGPQDLEHSITIDRIGLQGFSRGAVATFATAIKLNDLDIPIDIIANQPVPGDVIVDTFKESLYAKYKDLSHCHNIRTATTLLASYNLENGFIQNHFFQQMVVKFHPNTRVQNWIMPYQGHLDWFKSLLIPSHIQRQFANEGYTHCIWNRDEIYWFYQNSENLYFTPKEFSQKILGDDGSLFITKDPIYLEVQKEKAKLLLERLHRPYTQLSENQNSAILALSKINLEKKDLLLCVDFLLEKHAKAEKFIKKINKVRGVCEYLIHVTNSSSNHSKSEKIAEHSLAYKKKSLTQAMII